MPPRSAPSLNDQYKTSVNRVVCGRRYRTLHLITDTSHRRGHGYIEDISALYFPMHRRLANRSPTAQSLQPAKDIARRRVRHLAVTEIQTTATHRHWWSESEMIYRRSYLSSGLSLDAMNSLAARSPSSNRRCIACHGAQPVAGC